MVLISHLLLLGICPPHLGFLTYQGQTSVLTGLAFLSSSDELERSSSPGPEVIKLNGPVLAQVLYVSCSITSGLCLDSGIVLS